MTDYDTMFRNEEFSFHWITNVNIAIVIGELEETGAVRTRGDCLFIDESREGEKIEIGDGECVYLESDPNCGVKPFKRGKKRFVPASLGETLCSILSIAYRRAADDIDRLDNEDFEELTEEAQWAGETFYDAWEKSKLRREEEALGIAADPDIE